MADVEKRAGGRLAAWKPIRAFRNLFRRSPFPKQPRTATFEPLEWNPRFEVIENGDVYRFSADVPGVKRDDLEITTIGNRLQISGKRESEQEDTSDTIHTFEREYGCFARHFMLSDDADFEHARSELADGVLTVVIPKLLRAQLTKIPIST